MKSDSSTSGGVSAATSLRRKVLWLGLFSALLALALASSAKYLLNDLAGDSAVRRGIPELGQSKSQTVTIAPTDEPYYLDHSVVNRQDLPVEPNPAPMAIAAYD